MAEDSSDKMKWIIIGSVIGTAIATTVGVVIQHFWKRMGLAGRKR